MKNRMKNKGFTLIELLIVIIIIGVLATLAIPQYTKMVEKARSGEAKHILGTLRTGEALYYAEHRKYTANTDKLYVDVPIDNSAQHYFEYSIACTNTEVDFTATATRKIAGDTGKDPVYTEAYTITVNQAGLMVEGGP